MHMSLNLDKVKPRSLEGQREEAGPAHPGLPSEQLCLCLFTLNSLQIRVLPVCLSTFRDCSFGECILRKKDSHESSLVFFETFYCSFKRFGKFFLKQ